MTIEEKALIAETKLALMGIPPQRFWGPRDVLFFWDYIYKGGPLTPEEFANAAKTNNL